MVWYEGQKYYQYIITEDDFDTICRALEVFGDAGNPAHTRLLFQRGVLEKKEAGK